MNLPFANKVPERYYEMALDEAHRLLSPKEKQLVSIKVRPLRKYNIQSDSDFSNGYFYPDEYKEIDNFSSKFRKIREGSVSRGNAKVFSPYDRHEFLFVEHETGPEIIAYLALTTAIISLAKPIIELITQILKTLDEKNKKKQEGEPVNRFYNIEAVSIEERRKDFARIIKIIRLPLSESNSDINDALKQIKKILESDV